MRVCVCSHVMCVTSCVTLNAPPVQVQSQEEATSGVQAQVENVAVIAAPTVVAAVVVIGGAVVAVAVILALQW